MITNILLWVPGIVMIGIAKFLQLFNFIIPEKVNTAILYVISSTGVVSGFFDIAEFWNMIGYAMISFTFFFFVFIVLWVIGAGPIKPERHIFGK